MFNNLSETLESFFGNFSFALLFFAMVCYWIDTAFFDATKSLTKEVKATGFFAYSLPKVDFLKLENIATAAMVIANISLILLLLLRWQNSGHFPLSNLYESLMFLCWSCTSIYLFILKSTYPLVKKGNQLLEAYPTVVNGVLPTWLVPTEEAEAEDSQGKVVSKRQTFDLFFYKLLGSIASPCALFINAYATFSLPKEMQNAAPLVPALQSNWLMMHVTVMIISYSALMLGSLLAIAFLIVTSNLVVTSDIKMENLLFQAAMLPINPTLPSVGKRGLKRVSMNPPSYLASAALGLLPTVSKEQPIKGVSEVDKRGPVTLLSQDLPAELPVATETKIIFGTQDLDKSNAMQILAKNLDNLSYRILGIGFPFLTIGILSGAVWANEAWGSYWSWDPKETWALLTWLVFAIYLHMRLSHGWQGKKPAIMASVGFFTVWFCFLGVNLLGEGLHSYGWVLN